MISIKNLYKKFRTEDLETVALNNISFDIQEGEFVAIMGPSGCGKSTLLNVLGMIDAPSEGSYLFGEQEISGLSERQYSELRKGLIGFIFQKFNLIDELTVAENVELPLIYLNLPKAERKQKVKVVLERMGIAHRENHFPQQLSGGQQQRVAISRAVVTNPKLILADEPTGNLDSKNGIEVMNLLSELNTEEGATILMVTHSERDAKYANRIIHLFDGEIASVETINKEKRELVQEEGIR